MRQRLGHDRRRARHHGIDQRAARDGRRERADRIEAVGQREGAVARNAPRGRLEAGEAAQRGRDAHRAAGVGADGEGGHAVGDRDRRAGGGPAGDAPGRPVPRVARRVEMGVEAEAGIGELGHVGAPDHDRTGGAQPGDGGRVGSGRRLLRHRFRCGGGDVAGKVEQILDRNGKPRERRGHDAGAAQRIARRGRRARLGVVHLEERAPPLAGGIGDAGERVLHQPGGAGAPGGEICGKRENGCHGRLRARRYGPRPNPSSRLRACGRAGPPARVRRGRGTRGGSG